MKSPPCLTLVRLAPLVVVLLSLTGCVTSKKYRLAKDNTPPAQPLEWSVTTPSAELKLHALIVFKGPGFWKREARWDEYMVAITNRSTVPLALDSAELVDVLGNPQTPGDNPWKLEARSKANWGKYSGVGLNVVLGAGTIALYGAASASAAMGGLLGGSGAA